MNHHTSSSADKQLNNLIEFRQASYLCLGKARDAQFELADAIMLTPSPSPHSLAHLSLCPVFRRLWPSLYEALQDGTPDRVALLHLYIEHVEHSDLPTLAAPRVVLAGDHTAWPRLYARTLPDRSYQHQPTVIPGVRPITMGYGFSTLAWVPQAHGSWALPLLHERVTSKEDALDKAAVQLRAGCTALAALAALPATAKALRPLAMYDSQYGCAPFVAATAEIECDKIMRLRPNLSLRKAAPPYRGRGPYPKHGPAFRLKDPLSWGPPDDYLELEAEAEEKLGRVEVQLWKNLHFRASSAHSMTVIRITRPGARGTRADPKAQWLAWVGYEGEQPPPLCEWWSLYGRRFALDHWYRFAKQRLHWTLPALGTVEGCERWSDLMPLVTWQLWLAHIVAADRPLPWHKAQQSGKLTPGRVCAGMGGVIARIGTPTRAPKVRGKSSGWPKGCPRKAKERYLVLKKEKKKPKKAA